MQKGLNSDVSHQGENYHVQTEDKGIQNPYVVSQVFHRGAVLKSVKTHYCEVLSGKEEPAVESIRRAVTQQHQRILDQLLSGQLL